MPTKLISVVTPCYNEEANVRELYERIKTVFAALPAYRYEHIFIDNASQRRHRRHAAGAGGRTIHT